MSSRLNRALLAGAAMAVLMPAVAMAQVFQSQGPGPDTGAFGAVGSKDNPPNGTVGGALEAVIADPNNADVFYVGSVNGGIWKTTDGGQTWTALTDNQASLSIASLAFDPTDPTGQTIIGGVGSSSNGAFDFFNRGNVGSRSGALTGLLYTTNGGQSWSALGAADFAGQSVDAVAARGQTILAGTAEIVGGVYPPDSTGDKGLYRSADGGKTFDLVSGAAGSGLPDGPVTSIVGDPADANRFYAAVTAPNDSSFASAGVYVSDDAGAHWSKLFGAAASGGVIQDWSQTMIKLAVGPDGSVAAGVIDLNAATMTGLFLSKDSGSTWSALPVPYTNPGGQVTPNFAIAIDPKNANLVYVSGDNNYFTGYNTVAAYRVDASTNTFTDLTDVGGPVNTDNGSTVHPDSRALTFDANGRLIITTDGGIYARTNPQGSNGGWSSLNGDLSTFEAYGVAFDGASKRLIVSAQDNGSSVQSSPGSHTFISIGGGDGANAQVNDQTLPGYGAFYTNAQFLGLLQRIVLDSNGDLVSPLTGPSYAIGAPVYCDFNDCSYEVVGAWFLSPFVLNKVDPSMIALAGSDVYVARDTLTGAQDPSAPYVNLTLTDLGSTYGDPIATIAYGTRDNVDAIVAGDLYGGLYFSASSAAGSLTPLPAYAGAVPTSVSFDLRSSQRFFVTDSYSLFGTTDQGGSFQDLTGNLPAGFVQPTSTEFISENGVNALLVGGLNTPLSCTGDPNGCVISSSQSPITVADSSASGALSGWRAFGQGLPNALIFKMNYDSLDDVLAVSSIGRGAWLLYDVTSYFPQATVLRFGLADNDSAPDASFLTDGTSAHRPLVKYGSGTLTIDGAATYTGGTTIMPGGVLQLGNGGDGGSILGDVTDNGFLTFNRSDAYSFDGVISGIGGVAQRGAGETILTADSTYTGPTLIYGGTLAVDGSIGSVVYVGDGGVLGGNGQVGPTLVFSGGTVSPGHSVGALTINGDITFFAGQYLVELQDGAADRLIVNGTAYPGGTFTTAFEGGAVVPHYTVLTATGGLVGQFSAIQAVGAPSFISAALSYGADSVTLNLTSDLAGLAGLASNQVAVGTTLDRAFNSGDGSITGLFYVPGDAVPAALSQLSGEGVAGAQTAGLGAGDLFTGALIREALAAGDTGFQGSAGSRTGGDGPRHAWATGIGATATLDGQPSFGSSTLHRTAGGVAGGWDFRSDSGLVVGAGIGGTFSNVSVDALGTDGNINAFHIGAFAEQTTPRFYAAGAVSYAALWTDTTRRLSGVGPAEVETGRITSQMLAGRVEAGLRATGKTPVAPFAAVQFAQLWQHSFSETSLLHAGGTGVLGLHYRSASASSVASYVGFQTGESLKTKNGTTWTPYLRVAWKHEFTPERRITADFLSVPGTVFTVDGARPATDAASIQVGAGVTISARAKLFADMDSEISGRATGYGGRAGLAVTW